MIIVTFRDYRDLSLKDIEGAQRSLTMRLWTQWRRLSRRDIR